MMVRGTISHDCQGQGRPSRRMACRLLGQGRLCVQAWPNMLI